MTDFYKRVAVVFFLLTLATLLLGLICTIKFYNKEVLVPANNGSIPWYVEVAKDGTAGEGSAISVLNQSEQLEFDYTLRATDEFPFVKLFLVFGSNPGDRNLLDLSSYHKVSFDVQCSQSNILTFNLRTFDSKATNVDDTSSYRLASHWFDCSSTWSTEEINLKTLEVPAWWLDQYGIGIHDRSYSVDKVLALSFESSRRGPVGTHATVKVSKLTLHSFQWAYLGVFAFFCTVTWSGFVVWTLRQYTTSLTKGIQEKISQAKPLVAYQKLSMEPYRDKEKSAVLQYIAKEYANPELSMDVLIQHVGVNRKKVNEILREEIGFTFKAYLNKLRLTEAARLLGEQPDANISEIASLVGYKNVTHFNKIFKLEYGCSPGKFKVLNLTDANSSEAE